MSDSSGGDILLYAAFWAALHNPLWTMDQDDAREVLENSALTENLEITKVGGYSWLGCGLLSSGFFTEFEGTKTTKDGYKKKVEGVVCSGILSDSYLRFKS